MACFLIRFAFGVFIGTGWVYTRGSPTPVGKLGTQLDQESNCLGILGSVHRPAIRHVGDRIACAWLGGNRFTTSVTRAADLAGPGSHIRALFHEILNNVVAADQ